MAMFMQPLTPTSSAGRRQQFISLSQIHTTDVLVSGTAYHEASDEFSQLILGYGFQDKSRTQSFLSDPTPLCLPCSDHDDEPMLPAQGSDYDPPGDEEEDETLRNLMTIHRNLGHPPNKLLHQILREAQAPPATVTMAGNLNCPFCRRFTRIEPARPATVTHAKKFNETLCIDMAYYDLPEGKPALVVHFVEDQENTSLKAFYTRCEQKFRKCGFRLGTSF